MSWIRNAPDRQIQHVFKQAKKFGINDTWNKRSLNAFKKALENHVQSPETKIIKGTFHKRRAIHYYNSKTKLVIIRDEKGNFLSAWKLKTQQIYHIETTGSLGGAKKWK